MSHASRLSNMELLRILSMFAILMLHANLNALLFPTATDVSATPLSAFTRLFFGALTYGGVNVFVLISGWFGIHVRLRSVAGFLFQCLFFSAGTYLVCLAFGWSAWSLRGVADCFFFTPDGYWFVKAYFMLYLFSPVLNVFVERVPRSVFRNVLLAAFVFQTLYSGLAPGGIDAANFFMRGYSPLSFFLLYLLARYVRLYRPRFSCLSRRADAAVSFLLALLLAVHAFGSLRFGIPAPFLLFKYTSPVVVASALFVVLYFSKFEFHSRAVNGVALSCFAVYLFHCNNDVIAEYFLSTCRRLFASFDGVVYLFLTFAFLLSVFVVSVLADRLRLLCWRGVLLLHKTFVLCKRR